MHSKEKTLLIFLLALAVCAVILVLSPVTASGFVVFILSFPYMHIANGLRALSLSGVAGNVVAIALYISLCMTPIWLLPLIKRKKPEDAMLPLISIVLFIVMYYMINPGFIPISHGTASIEGALLGGVVHSLIFSYGVIRILRLTIFASSHTLGQYMAVVLHVVCILLVFTIFGMQLSQMLDALQSVANGNSGNPQLGFTRVFIMFRYVAGAAIHVIHVAIVFAALRLVAAFSCDKYSHDTLNAARLVSKLCVVSLVAGVVVAVGVNLLQLVFIRRLAVVDTSLHIPVMSMICVLSALLMTRYMAESKELKDENDQIV